MRLYGKLLSLSLILFFFLGIVWGMAAKQNNLLKNPKGQHNESSKGKQGETPQGQHNESPKGKQGETPQRQQHNPHREQQHESPNLKEDNLLNNDLDNKPMDTKGGLDQKHSDSSGENNNPNFREDIYEDMPPDEKYYRLAEPLQRRFPELFFMKSATENKKIALTFDDGPDNYTTPKILDILNEYKVTATFFVIGANTVKYPDTMKRLEDEGHQIANHSWSHQRPTLLSDEKFLEEINPINQIPNDYTVLTEPFYYRPPYGLLTPSQVEKMGDLGYLVISWSIDSLDWTDSDPREIRDKVINSVHPGAIILMHSAGGKDRRTNTVKALPGIIENLLGQGYEFVTIEKLLGKRD